MESKKSSSWPTHTLTTQTFLWILLLGKAEYLLVLAKWLRFLVLWNHLLPRLRSHVVSRLAVFTFSHNINDDYDDEEDDIVCICICILFLLHPIDNTLVQCTILISARLFKLCVHEKKKLEWRRAHYSKTNFLITLFFYYSFVIH